MLLTGIISSILARYGIHHADRNNWLPKNHYQKKALDALKHNDIEGAIENNRITRGKDPDYQEAQILRDLIMMWIDTRKKQCEKAIMDNSDRIEQNLREERSAARKKTGIVLIHTLSAVILLIIPYCIPYLFGALSQGSPPYMLFLICYTALLAGAIFLYIKTYLFNPEKSPLIRLHEYTENTKAKRAIAEKTVIQMNEDLENLNRLRAQSAEGRPEPSVI
ncbi:hypothetical protein ACFL5L_05465 [candidate division KSB1 bacterium]